MNVENRQPYSEDEQELDLIEVIVQLLHRWKLIILCAVIFGILLGGLKCVKGIISLKNQAAVVEAAEDTADEAETYEIQKALIDSQIKSVNESILQCQEYRDNSVLMHLDPYNHAETSVIWYVNSYYTLDSASSIQETDPAVSLIGAYQTKLSSAEFYGYLSDKLDGEIDKTNLQDLSTIEADFNTHMLTITVAAEKLSQAETINEAIKEYMNEQQELIYENVAEHELTLISDSCFVTGNDSAAGVEINADTMTTVSVNSVVTKQKDFDDQLLSLNNSLIDLQKKKNDLKEPSASNPLSKKGVLKSAIKYGIVGGVGGAFLACAWIFVVMLFSDGFYSEQEIKDRYGVVILGSLKRFKQKGIFERICGFLSGDKYRQSDITELSALADANIRSRLLKLGKEDENVLLAGSDKAKLEELAAALNNASGCGRYQVCGDILNDAAAVDMLKSYTAVAVCEKKGAVARKTLSNSFAKLNGLDKNVIGLIAL